SLAARQHTTSVSPRECVPLQSQHFEKRTAAATKIAEQHPFASQAAGKTGAIASRSAGLSILHPVSPGYTELEREAARGAHSSTQNCLRNGRTLFPVRHLE